MRRAQLNSRLASRIYVNNLLYNMGFPNCDSTNMLVNLDGLEYFGVKPGLNIGI
jgi:hypothetical protein